MTFPTVGSRLTQAFSSSTTSHAVAMPGTVLANRLLLILFDSGSQSVTTPSGWTAINPAGGFSNGGARRVYVFKKIATGSEGGTTVDCVTGVATLASAIVYYLSDSGYAATDIAIAASGATGTGTTPNPASLTSGFGAVDTLWIAAYNGGSPSAYPASYSNGQNSVGFGLASAERQTTAASEDAGAFTAGSTTWVAFTIAVRAPTPVTLDTVSEAEVEDGQTGVILGGTNFKATQSTGGVFLGDSSDYGTATLTGQTETSWGATSITVTIVRGLLDLGPAWLFVVNSDGGVSAGYAVTLLEPEPALLAASVEAAAMDIVIYDGSSNQLGALVDILDPVIHEGINGAHTASFKLPLTATGASLATVMREIQIRRIGEGVLFHGYIVKVGRPVDEDGLTVVAYECMSLAVELQRMQTWRSMLLLAETAQSGLDELLTDTGWTGDVLGGGYDDLTKDFVNVSRLAAVTELADFLHAYWRQTTTTREIELKNYHSPSGIVLTNVEQPGPDSRLGFIESIDVYDEDGSAVVNRVSAEMKTDGNRLITLQESTRTTPYTIQNVALRLPRVVSATLALVVTRKVSALFTMLGENRYAVAVYAGPTGMDDDFAATIGGQFLESLGVAVNDVAMWGGISPPKGQPVVDFEAEAASATVAGIVGLENVDQIDPVFAAASNSGSSTTPSVSVASDEDCLVIAWLTLRTIGTPTVTPTASQTLIDTLSGVLGGFDPDQMTAWQKDGDPSTTSFTWTISPSQAWEAHAVALRAAKIYYIEDEDSIDAYGLSEQVIELSNLPEVEANNTELANAAYGWLVNYLDKYKEPPRFYGVRAAYLPGSPRDWLPGDTVRVEYYSANLTISERLIVVERTHSYDENGVRSWALTLSNQPQMPIDELAILASLVKRVDSTQANQV